MGSFHLLLIFLFDSGDRGDEPGFHKMRVPLEIWALSDFMRLDPINHISCHGFQNQCIMLYP